MLLWLAEKCIPRRALVCLCRPTLLLALSVSANLRASVAQRGAVPTPAAGEDLSTKHVYASVPPRRRRIALNRPTPLPTPMRRMPSGGLRPSPAPTTTSRSRTPRRHGPVGPEPTPPIVRRAQRRLFPWNKLQRTDGVGRPKQLTGLRESPDVSAGSCSPNPPSGGKGSSCSPAFRRGTLPYPLTKATTQSVSAGKHFYDHHSIVTSKNQFKGFAPGGYGCVNYIKTVFK